MKLPHYLESPDPSILMSDNYTVLDFENTIIEGNGSATNVKNRVIFASWIKVVKGVPRYKYLWGNEYELGPLIEDLDKSDFLVAHNTKHELQWLKRAGWDIGKIPSYCTMLGQKVRYGNLPYGLGLDEVAKFYGIVGKTDLVKKWMSLGLCPSTYPKEILQSYGNRDTAITHKVFLLQRKYLYENGLLPTAFTRFILTPVLADIEFNGCYLDKERVLSYYKELSEEYNIVDSELVSFTEGINLNSPTQMAEFLYTPTKEGGMGFKELTNRYGKPNRNKPTKKFPEGLPLTDQETVSKLVARTKRQETFLELKKKQGEMNAALTKTLKPFYSCVTEKEDPIIYFRLNQHITKTHRLSSTGTEFSVQGQNMPNKYKRLITIRNPEYDLMETDYAKLEFVGAAFLSQDPQAVEDVLNHFDVHKYSAAVMKFGYEEADDNLDNISKEERRLAKKDTFGPLYGKTTGTPEQIDYFEAFKKKYKILNQVQEGWINEVLSSKDKCLTTITGLKFYFPEASISKRGYVVDNTKIRNWPIQSFSTAEIVPIGVTYLWHMMRGMKSFIINTIHDSVIKEVHKEEREVVSHMTSYAMIDKVYMYLEKVYNIKFNLPLEIEKSIGTHWGEGVTLT